MSITSKPTHGQLIAGDKPATAQMQAFMDDVEGRLNDRVLGGMVKLDSYTVATLPDATKGPGLIFVSDEVGGAVLAFSDGTSWRRCTDRAVVS